MNIYDSITDGIDKYLDPGEKLPPYLESLKSSVRLLRRAYRVSPVSVPYHKKEVQGGYLTTYLPHYYQLIHKILIEEASEIFERKERIRLVFIGGGPGSELYGVIKYIANNCPEVREVRAIILDLNGEAWSYSHRIVKEFLIDTISPGQLELSLESRTFDLVSHTDISGAKSIFSDADLIVVQNCLNEIGPKDFGDVLNNIEMIFSYAPVSSYLLVADLTSGARKQLLDIEQHLHEKHTPKFSKSTLSNPASLSMLSLHDRPSNLIRRHLLDGTDGLIPRRFIKYDYGIYSKGQSQRYFDREALGFRAIYRPLDFKKLDANDYLHKKTFIGIDFGTSSTVVCISSLLGETIVVTPIPFKQRDQNHGSTRSALVPSVISVVNGGRVLFGKYANDFKQMLEYGIDCWYGFKMKLSKLDDILYAESVLWDSEKYRIRSARDSLILFFKYIHYGISEYIKENHLSPDIEYSISIPTGLDSKEKQALRSCFLEAGIDCQDVPFIEEPNAALINYLFERNISFENSTTKHIFILDLGAGTVDATIIKVDSYQSELSYQLLSVSRYGFIGGNKIDKLVLETCLKRSKVATSLSQKQVEFLLTLSEQLKIMLCQNVRTDRTVKFELPSISRSTDLVTRRVPTNETGLELGSIQLSYREFGEIMEHYWAGDSQMTGIKTTIERTLLKAGLGLGHIDQIILTGGGGRNPYIKSLVANLFGPVKLFVPDNIQEHVARGASLNSLVLNSFGKFIMTPILNETYFVEGSNKSIPVFEQGQFIPSHDVEIFLVQEFLEDDYYISSYLGEGKTNYKYFHLPKDVLIEKLIFYVDPDQELKCEIVSRDRVIEAKEYYHIDSPILLALK